MKESLRMQRYSKTRITAICAAKTTSDPGTVTLLENFHALHFFHSLSRLMKNLLLLLRQIHLLMLLFLAFEKRFILQTVLEFFSV